MGGIAAWVLGFSKLHALAHEYDYTSSARFAWSFAYIGVLMVSVYGMGFPELRRSRRDAYVGAVQSALVAALAMSIFQLVTGDALLPRFVVFGSAIVSVPWTILCARFAALGTSRAEDRDRVVVVASAADREALATELGSQPERSAVLVGALDPTAAGTVATGGSPLLQLARDTDASVIVLSRDAQADESIVAQAALLHETGIRVRTLSLFYEEWLGKLPMSELERVSLMFDIGEVHRNRYLRVKRLLDVALSLPGLLAFALFTPLVLVGNAFGNRGPLFYRQVRVGKQGHLFAILKFRSMVDDCAPTGSTCPEPRHGAAGGGSWTLLDDPRITRFGRLLRTTHVDEMPQVLNILRGDLSVVGPRPEQPHYVDELVEKLPFYALRHLVRPGLTGWAQVKYHYASDERDALEKLQYEFFYLRHQGIALDLRIIGRTVRTVTARAGR
jgi:lipopolysaccharide/colanic/teichoic acid biosynthesis glycosyltransferase